MSYSRPGLHAEEETTPDPGMRASSDGGTLASGLCANRPGGQEPQQFFKQLSFAEKEELYHQLSPEEKQQLYQGLSPQEQQHVSGVQSPGQVVSDRIWLIIVTSFACVLLGAFLSLAANVFLAMFRVQAPTDSANLQLLLTMFTSAVGFLAGLLVPSPARNNT